MTQPEHIHFIDKSLINPTNPVTVSLIGAGGTGSQVLTALARINHALLALNHAGLFVQVFDNDIVTTANLGRQLFAASETGLNKAVALVNRINRFFGTNWKAIPSRYKKETATITISCVDNARTRFEISGDLKQLEKENRLNANAPLYWIDFGNSRYTGQVVLSTVGFVKQPRSNKYVAVSHLPLITDEFKNLLRDDKVEPSCSLAEALEKQDLFINSTLASLGSSLLWTMFREGMIKYRGFFLNLKDIKVQPLPVNQQKILQ